MEHWKLTQWCTYAVSKIKYAPDRRAVYDELRQHLDDRCEDLLAQGMSEDEAAERAIALMGDPKEIAPYFGAIHRPFWGYLYSTCKILAIITAVFLVFIFLAQFWRISTDASIAPPAYNEYRWNPYAETVPSKYTRTMYAEPGARYTDSGYLVELSRVSCIKTAESRNSTVFFQLEITSLLPWADDPDFCNYIFARDSFGNIYSAGGTRMLGDKQHYGVSGKNYRTSPLTWIYDAAVYNVHPNAQWIELRYERSGRQMVFRIDLTGGEIG